ncbi:DUF551 domain-containing protein [Yersinia aleksiciae]|uniref:Protein of uncharacterized function (DUF551) n=1 Tax=Yersinia aleksiciae TaxID=263819 RepID=A0A0T9V0K5_YERAE|nr:DUF551 domain-containing protein [Yersinia aleksiciae]CNL92024.1 Protein of uncharacterised function (DUF551) [Yersinia aleksiciae]
MKSLDSFTVERLEEIKSAFADRVQYLAPTIEEVEYLIDIALAAKRAEPVAYGTLQKEFCDEERSLFTDKDSASKYSESCYDLTPLYTTPQLNSQQGWIKCSDQMPENSNIQCFVYCKDSLRRTGYFDGDDWAINGKYYDESFITHWQKFPAAPEKENG